MTAQAKQYQPLTVSFTKVRFPFTYYNTRAELLVPVDAMPEVQAWMNRNIPPGESGNDKLIDFLMAKGGMLHCDNGPAYRVSKSFMLLLEPHYTPVCEEYWVKGERQQRPLAHNKALRLNGRPVTL